MYGVGLSTEAVLIVEAAVAWAGAPVVVAAAVVASVAVTRTAESAPPSRADSRFTLSSFVGRGDDQALRVGRVIPGDSDLQQIAARVDLSSHPVVLGGIQLHERDRAGSRRQCAADVAVPRVPQEHDGAVRCHVLGAFGKLIHLAIG